MDASRYRQVQAVFADALERPTGERDAYLSRICGTDAEMRAEVESLLRASEAADDFFGGLEERVSRAADGEGPEDMRTDSVRSALEAAIGGRYRVQSLLARGGMGLVFLAVDDKHARKVAIKTILPRADAELGPRFQREIRITAALQHPNVLPLLDSGVAGAVLFYIMPYVDGESLKTRLDRVGRIDPHEAVRIGVGVADALAHAHARGVLHRDIKPSNILLAEDQVQVVDFGIGRDFTGLVGDDLTRTGLAMGTPRYMAPERYEGRSTTASDIFSLGAVLIECVTGRPWRLGMDLSTGEGLPAGLGPVLSRAVHESPSERWAGASDFGEALRGWHRDQVRGVSRDTSPAEGGWLAGLRRKLRRAEATAEPKSIAVLPFGNLTGDAETEYFSDGVTEDIIAHLSRIGELKVISRTSVMRYKDTGLPLPKIGRELRVRHILEGSVRRAGSRVRVVSQLIEVDSDTPTWTETFDRELTDIFEIQSEIAQRIADALRARVSDTQRAILRRRPTADLEAHDLYLKGRYLWNRRTQTALEGAEEQFQRAVARDPLFAPAYAGLADVHLLLAGYGYRKEVESLHRARTAVERALQLDEELAEAHASRGQILRADRDWAGEEREYRRAIEINRNYATAHQWYATLLSALGRQAEAVAEIDRAVELDPLSHAISVTSGIVRFLAGDIAAAQAELDRTVDLAPRFFSSYAWRVILLSHIGEHERAHEALRSLREFHPNPGLARYAQAYAFARAGEHEQAVAVMEAPGGTSVDAGWRGIIWGWLGDEDAAFRLLEEALDDPSWRLFVLQRTLLFYMKVGPWFDPLREDPRFEGLLRRMRMIG